MVLICTIMCQEWMIVFAQFIEIFSCLELLKMNVILMKWSLYYSKKYSCFYTTAIDDHDQTSKSVLSHIFYPTIWGFPRNPVSLQYANEVETYWLTLDWPLVTARPDWRLWHRLTDLCWWRWNVQGCSVKSHI